MSTLLFYPSVSYVKTLFLRRPSSLRELCARAGVNCLASGAWTEREIEIIHGQDLKVTAEPGDWGRVQISTPLRGGKLQARQALELLSYGMHDLVAKQSIKGKSWAYPTAPRGRPKKARALSAAERQRRFRSKMLKS